MSTLNATTRFSIRVGNSIRYRPRYPKRIEGEVLGRFFASGEYVERTLPNEQRFDYEGLEGRLLSSSYTPSEGEPGYQAMLSVLRQIFERYQVSGGVRFLYDTRLFIGRVTSLRHNI